VRLPIQLTRRTATWLLGTAVVATAALMTFHIHTPRPLPAGVARAAGRVAGDDWTGRVAPGFELRALDGRRIRLSDFRDRVVLVNFWATWCAPCRVEMPWLREFDARYGSQGLTILGVSVDDGGRERVERFVRQMRVEYPILLSDGNVDLRYGGVRFLPQTFFVGRDGRITRRVYGIRTHEDFEAEIRSALELP